ncbi:MAG TPA: cell envelope integrity protein TolA [Candidatus Acidoferrales bacterium]|nr:cell envelope integrity protein TolA [Candidatus Acidoferrales bacterium]
MAEIKREDLRPLTRTRDRSLWGWIFFSGLMHGAAVGVLVYALSLPVNRTVNYPVYTVDLVGGEKIGGFSAGSEPPRTREAKKAKPVETARVEKQKKPVVEEKKPANEPAKDLAKAERQPKALEKPATKELPDDLRDKLIQAAIERVKERAGESAERSAGEASAREKSAKKAEPLSSGPGEGVGAAAPGVGGYGGGVQKGLEFVMYHNKMLQVIKERWSWAGRRTDLQVTVRFGIKENGEIVGLRITQASGDRSFDDSVLRAVRGANPLAPPPEAYRADFSDVELTFRPGDLKG